MRFLLILILVFTIISSLDAPLLATESCNSNCLLQEFPLPGSPLNIIAAEQNFVWFTLPISNAIGSLQVESSSLYTVSLTVIPTVDGRPYDLAYDDSNGTIWFSEELGGKIGKLDINASTITEYQIPTAASRPRGIDLAPDGTVWFVESGTNIVGQFDPSSSSFSEFLYAPRNVTGIVELEDIAVQDNDSIWFSAPLDHEVVEFRPSLEPEQQFAPTFFGSNRRPLGLALSAGGDLWATDAARGEVRKYVPGTLVTWVNEALNSASGEPSRVAVDREGNHVFVSAPGAGVLAQIINRSSGQLRSRQYALAAEAKPFGVAVDGAGTVWAADSERNRIIRWQSPHFYETWLPAVENNREPNTK